MQIIGKAFLLVIYVSIIFSSTAHADNPAEFCGSAVGCTEEMKDISQIYDRGAIYFNLLSDNAFSGPCYHLNSLYDPNIQHYGAFAFEKIGSDILSGGIFSFFFERDPYEKLSGPELKYLLKKKSTDFKKLVILDTEVKLEYLSTNSNISYWFRISSDKKNLLVIGRDVGDQAINLIFCKMTIR